MYLWRFTQKRFSLRPPETDAGGESVSRITTFIVLVLSIPDNDFVVGQRIHWDPDIGSTE